VTRSGSLTRLLIVSYAACSSELRLSRSSALPIIEISLLVPLVYSFAELFGVLLGSIVAPLWDASGDAFERAPLLPPLRCEWESMGALSSVLRRWFIGDWTSA
jgi:hypothetical protein